MRISPFFGQAEGRSTDDRKTTLGRHIDRVSTDISGYVGRYIGRVSADMSTDISVEGCTKYKWSANPVRPNLLTKTTLEAWYVHIHASCTVKLCLKELSDMSKNNLTWSTQGIRRIWKGLLSYSSVVIKCKMTCRCYRWDQNQGLRLLRRLILPVGQIGCSTGQSLVL